MYTNTYIHTGASCTLNWPLEAHAKGNRGDSHIQLHTGSFTHTYTHTDVLTFTWPVKAYAKGDRGDSQIQLHTGSFTHTYTHTAVHTLTRPVQAHAKGNSGHNNIQLLRLPVSVDLCIVFEGVRHL